MSEAPSSAKGAPVASHYVNFVGDCGKPVAAKKKGLGVSPGYDSEERIHLFTVIKEVVPVDGNDWEYESKFVEDMYVCMYVCMKFG
jgi:hypothetical protein